MESTLTAFFSTLGTATFTEIGDKTQLLAFVLGARFRKPMQVLAGIAVGNICNHAFAVILGEQAREYLTQSVTQEILIVAFMAMAIWVLFPDRIDTKMRTMFAASDAAFIAAAVGTFVTEIGDKTEIMAALFGARYGAYLPVVFGATAGSLLADIPVVLAGRWASHHVQAEWLCYFAAAIFLMQAGLVFAF